MRKIIFSYLILCLLHLDMAQGQTKGNSNLLQDLERELYFGETQKVPFLEIAGCRDQRIDSAHQVRAARADAAKVLPILKDIAMTKDPALIAPLVELYQKQIAIFQEDWEVVQKNNFYACNAADRQFHILEIFEEAVHSLQLEKRGLSADEKFDHLKQQLNSLYRYYHVRNAWYDEIEKWDIYSPYYYELRKKRWIGPPSNYFCFIEPYLNEIGEKTLGELSLFIKNKKDERQYRFEDYLLSQMCRMVGRNSDPVLTQQLLEIAITDPDHKSRNFITNVYALMQNRENGPFIKQAIIKHMTSANVQTRLNALMASVYFPEQEVLDGLIQVRQSTGITADEMVVAGQILENFARRPELPEETKNQILELLQESK